MREIKFRGFNGEKWLFGSLEIDYKAVHACISDNRFWRLPVRFNSVGQFTGLKDCKGREIYEGDVIRVCGSNGIVVYSEGAFIVRFEKAPSLLSHCVGGYFSNPERVSACRVIGNVHDNPELLERKP